MTVIFDRKENSCCDVMTLIEIWRFPIELESDDLQFLVACASILLINNERSAEETQHNQNENEAQSHLANILAVFRKFTQIGWW